MYPVCIEYNQCNPNNQTTDLQIFYTCSVMKIVFPLIPNIFFSKLLKSNQNFEFHNAQERVTGIARCILD